MVEKCEIIYFYAVFLTIFFMFIEGRTMKQISLPEISQRLESYEETIVFKLIDRAQYAADTIIYERGKSGFKGAGNLSLLELRLRFQEQMDTQFGKFCIPEERPFIKSSSAPRRKAMVDDRGILIEDCNIINLTEDIMMGYRAIIPLICETIDDGHYGSAVEHDVYALQAISRRIHFGSLYAAEAKYTADPESFKKLIADGDQDGIMKRLTRKAVEDNIIKRVREKTESTQALVNKDIRRVIKPEVVVQFYQECIIPLTKRGQVQYLLNRKETQSNAV
jgi:chorismate mutase